MKKVTKKIFLCILSALLAMTMLFASSCSNDSDTEQTSDTAQESKDTNALYIVVDGASDYTIVRPKSGTREEANAALELRALIQNKRRERIPRIRR